MRWFNILCVGGLICCSQLSLAQLDESWQQKLLLERRYKAQNVIASLRSLHADGAQELAVGEGYPTVDALNVVCKQLDMSTPPVFVVSAGSLADDYLGTCSLAEVFLKQDVYVHWVHGDDEVAFVLLRRVEEQSKNPGALPLKTLLLREFAKKLLRIDVARTRLVLGGGFAWGFAQALLARALYNAWGNSKYMAAYGGVMFVIGVLGLRAFIRTIKKQEQHITEKVNEWHVE